MSEDGPRGLVTRAKSRTQKRGEGLDFGLVFVLVKVCSARMERAEDGIAVVGIGCNFPGGNAFYNLLFQPAPQNLKILLIFIY